MTPPGELLAPRIRGKFDGTLMLNGGYDASSGNGVIESGLADLVSFGIPFLANPDLPDRFRKNAPLNREDPSTFYTGEEKGYTDYPALGSGEEEKRIPGNEKSVPDRLSFFSKKINLHHYGGVPVPSETPK